MAGALKISLALSGGAARGAFHLGVIAALERNNVEIAAVSGTSIGAVLGVLLSYVITDLISGIEKLLGMQFLHSDVYPISYLPSNLYWSDVVQVVAISLFICFFAALYPAWRASRIQPADALRYE